MSAERNEHHPGLGSLLIGYVLLGLQPIPVALLAGYKFSSAETVFARFAFSAVALFIICAARRRGLRTAQPKVLLLRGMLGGTAVLLYFYSIQEAGAARGTLLNYTYPVWANFFALALGQRPNLRFWLGLAASLVGLWLVIVPSGGLGPGAIGLGEWAGLLSALFAGGAVLTIKQLRETDESLTIIASFSVFGLLMSAPLVDWQNVGGRLSFDAVSLAFLVGLSAFFGHVFFTRGYRGVSVAHATLLSLLVPVVAALAGIWLLEEEFSARFIAGALIILTALSFVLTGRSASGTGDSASE